MGPCAGEWLQLRIRGDSLGKSWGRRCRAPGHAASRSASGGGQGGRVQAAAKRPPSVPGTEGGGVGGRREGGTGCSARRCPLGPGAEADQAGCTRTRSRLLWPSEGSASSGHCEWASITGRAAGPTARPLFHLAQRLPGAPAQLPGEKGAAVWLPPSLVGTKLRKGLGKSTAPCLSLSTPNTN